jgi:pimeloyl-ACP methyl ester carboxylesterase
LVLVHGGGHAADCWDPAIEAIARLAPELRVLAVDLPGRRSRPGDLRALTVADWVASVVRDVDDAGLDDVVLVGHSLAGLTIPGVAAELGATRVRELVFAAAFVPPEGRALVDTMRGIPGLLARRAGRTGNPGTTPRWFAVHAYMNGMTREQRRMSLSRLCGESSAVLVETISRRTMPEEVPRTWILTLRDHALPVRTQRAGIAALGGVQTVIEMDTCHNLMISEPTRLAEILVARCRRHDR